MKGAAIRGWQFDGAALGSTRSGLSGTVGLKLTPAGHIAMVEEEAAIRQSIIMLLTTSPGERVMRPKYGCPLHRLMFAPNDATTAGLAIHYVRQALMRFEPRVDIVYLDAHADQNQEASLIISLSYRTKATNRLSTLNFALNLNGEEV